MIGTSRSLNKLTESQWVVETDSYLLRTHPRAIPRNK